MKRFLNLSMKIIKLLKVCWNIGIPNRKYKSFCLSPDFSFLENVCLIDKEEMEISWKSRELNSN